MKKCRKCLKEKPLTDFYRASNLKSGYRNACKDCERAYNKKWQSNPSSKKIWRKASRKHDNRPARRKRLYGISPEEFESLKIAQNNRCGICNKVMSIVCVDHDHTTKKVRGLLCSRCNRAIGLLGDTEESLESALIYLRGGSVARLVS
jgi:Recombination endonuclease VII